MSNKFPAHVRHAMGLASTRRMVQPPRVKTDETVLSQHPGKGYCTIFDVGAGDGKKCIQWLLEKNNVLVYAFEPDPSQFEKLQKARNSLDIDQKRRLQIFNVAVSNENTDASDFYVCNDHSSSSLLPFVQENLKNWKYPPGRHFFKTTDIIKVPTIRLDDFMDTHSVQYIDFLHIEVQGVVNRVFDSLTSKRLRHVKEILWKVHITDFEIYKNQATEEPLIEYLKKNNFVTAERSYYSRNQERFIRSIHLGWKERGARIYGFK